MQIVRSRDNRVFIRGNYSSPWEKHHYRSPNQNTALVLEKFNNILSRISKDNKQCYMMGYFNLDLLQYTGCNPTLSVSVVSVSRKVNFLCSISLAVFVFWLFLADRSLADPT